MATATGVRRIAAAGVGALLLTATACGNTVAPPPATHASVTHKTATPPPAWTKKYSRPQLKAYDEALARFTSYEHRSEQYWSAGKATPAARKLFEEYFGQADLIYGLLESYQQSGLQVDGLPVVLSSRATGIALGKAGGQVTIRQCANYAYVAVTQHDKTTPVKLKTPMIRTIQLDRLAKGRWKIYKLSEPAGGKKTRSCTH